MQVKREEFLRCLESVQPGLSAKEFVEQSSCFVFQDGNVHTFNDEIYCCMKSSLDEDFTGAVKSKKLLEMLREIPDDEIKIETGKSGNSPCLIVRGKNKRFGVSLEQEVVLGVNNVESPGEWKPLHADFLDAIDAAQRCVSTQTNHFPYTHIYITPDWIESTDRQQLLRWKLKTGVSEPMLVRQPSIKHVTQLGMTEFSETSSWIHFQNKIGLVLSCRRYMEEFPDLGGLFDIEGTPIVLPKGLIDVVSRASICSEEISDNNRVHVTLKPGKVRVQGIGVTCDYSQWSSVKYTGEVLDFSVSPDMLTDLVQKHNSVTLGKNRIMAEIPGKYIWVACLSAKEAEVEESEEEDGK